MAIDDLFWARLGSMIDMRNALLVLATRIPWAEIESSLNPMLAHQNRSVRMVQDADLFGPTPQLAGAGPSSAGRPRLSVRLMVALLYLGTPPTSAMKNSASAGARTWSGSFSAAWRTTSRSYSAMPRRSVAALK